MAEAMRTGPGANHFIVGNNESIPIKMIIWVIHLLIIVFRVRSRFQVAIVLYVVLHGIVLSKHHDSSPQRLHITLSYHYFINSREDSSIIFIYGSVECAGSCTVCAAGALLSREYHSNIFERRVSVVFFVLAFTMPIFREWNPSHGLACKHRLRAASVPTRQISSARRN